VLKFLPAFFAVMQGKYSGFHHIVASAQSEFFEQLANFDKTDKDVKSWQVSCY